MEAAEKSDIKIISQSAGSVDLTHPTLRREQREKRERTGKRVASIKCRTKKENAQREISKFSQFDRDGSVHRRGAKVLVQTSSKLQNTFPVPSVYKER